MDPAGTPVLGVALLRPVPRLLPAPNTPRAQTRTKTVLILVPLSRVAELYCTTESHGKGGSISPNPAREVNLNRADFTAK